MTETPAPAVSPGDGQFAQLFDRARAFVLRKTTFAQLTTIDLDGYPAVRTVTAFLEPDWSVTLIQRRTHRRLSQWRENPRTLVAWVGAPAPGASNESPHVFDINQLPPRMVAVRGDVRFKPEAWTREHYAVHVAEQRSQGFTRAPLRTPDQVDADLVGLSLRPYRVRIEGFGEGARAFTWNIGTDGRVY